MRLRIGIATAGRFYVLDLARELSRLGHDVRFYSFVPKRRAMKFGLPADRQVSLLPFAAPLVAWERLLPRIGREVREQLTYAALNRAVMLRMQPCDVFIFMSGIYLEAAHEARRRFGAKLWLERGSQHVLAQNEIMHALGGELASPLTVRRELEGYAIADRIVVASTHVEESFRRDPLCHAKLFRNPYGVDTRMFTPPKPRARDGKARFLYVGTWSLRKGCDVLTEAVQRLSNAEVVHVGPIADCAFPQSDSRFRHHDAVPQWQLPKFYAEADAFVLASREDGFGVVLGQALASGLPVIGTDRTGAPDLALTPRLAERIFTVPSGDVNSLAAALSAFQDRLLSAGSFEPLTPKEREALSWSAYGQRYNAELLKSFDRHIAA
jgi:glycosyltransferase involved in cell wall biosynthesis